MSFPVEIDLLIAVNKIISDAEDRLTDLVGYKVKLKASVNYKEINEILIQNKVCETYNVRWHQIKSTTRKREVVMARHAYCYLCKFYELKNDTAIGLDIARDRTTVNHSYTTILNYIGSKDKFAEPILEIIRQIKP